MITSVTTPYRTCRVCKDDKPQDELHYRVFSAVNHRFSTACRACELDLAARRGEMVMPAPEPVIPRETPPIQLGLGGRLHHYLIGKDESTDNAANNPTGRNGATDTTRETAYQSKTIRLWLDAIRTLAERYGMDSKQYDRKCDELWVAIPRGDEWTDEVYHAGFAVLVQRVLGEA